MAIVYSLSSMETNLGPFRHTDSKEMMIVIVFISGSRTTNIATCGGIRGVPYKDRERRSTIDGSRGEIYENSVE